MFTTLQTDVGAQWYDLNVKTITRETNRSVTITLESLDPQAEFCFQAGQYISLMIDINGETYCRSYSISSAPYEEEVRITVQAIDGGVVSNYLNDKLVVGDTLRCSEACGDFIARSAEKQKLFIAAGSGITPVMSLLKNHLYSSNEICHLYYFSRNYEETIFVQEIASLCRLYGDRLYVHYWHSTPQGRFDFDFDKLKRLKEALYSAPDVYLCGPNEWMSQFKQALKPYRFGLGSIYSEAFSAINEEVGQNSEACHHEVRVTIAGKVHTIEASNNESILSALRRHKVPVAFGCELGKCGCCIAKVNSGKLDNSRINFLTSEELDDGYTLCCQATALSDLDLEQC